MENVVNLATASLLKALGYKENTCAYYSEENNFKKVRFGGSNNEYKDPASFWQTISAPTLLEAQEYLRTNYSLDISIIPEIGCCTHEKIYIIHLYETVMTKEGMQIKLISKFEIGGFENYEACLDKAVYVAIEYIIHKNSNKLSDKA